MSLLRHRSAGERPRDSDYCVPFGRRILKQFPQARMAKRRRGQLLEELCSRVRPGHLQQVRKGLS